MIVNADDLGRSAGVNEGIARAHREGIVTSATLMANAPGGAAAGTLARALPRLDVGVHLVLTFGRPLSDPARIRSLVERDGSFPKAPEAFVGTARADAGEALLEYRAQYGRARELIGREPTHLDTHHWVHDEPALEDAVARLAEETGAAVRIHGDAQRDRLRSRGIRTPDRFVRAFQHEGHVDVRSLTRVLAGIDDGVSELMCHPGESGDADLLATSAYAALRPVELATLTDPAVRRALDRLEIGLATFADL
ncbi:MAG TPA: ChbG/HpnK family deacetylase [Candidatus Limnocylindria bacterium]|nr:ChbG/HpnK family deacetylase [Candidatus Limnocylindria bacterium]